MASPSFPVPSQGGQPVQEYSGSRCIDDLLGYWKDGDLEAQFRQGVLWNKIYHRSLLDGLSFDKSLDSFVDQPFNLAILSKVDRVAYVPERLYRYYVRQGSVSHPLGDFRPAYLLSGLSMMRVLPADRVEDRTLMLRKTYRQMLIIRACPADKEEKSMVEEICRRIIETTGREYRNNRRIPFTERQFFRIAWRHPALFRKLWHLSGN